MSDTTTRRQKPATPAAPKGKTLKVTLVRSTIGQPADQGPAPHVVLGHEAAVAGRVHDHDVEPGAGRGALARHLLTAEPAVMVLGPAAADGG